MFHTYAARFDVTENLKTFAKFFKTKQGLTMEFSSPGKVKLYTFKLGKDERV